MSEIKRYTTEVNHGEVFMEESSNGIYVFYEDHLAALASQAQQPEITTKEIDAEFLKECADENGHCVLKNDVTFALGYKSGYQACLASQAQQEIQWTSLENFTFVDGQSIYAFDSHHPDMGVLEAVYKYRGDCMVQNRVETVSGSSFATGDFTHFMVRNLAPLPPAPEGE